MEDTSKRDANSSSWRKARSRMPSKKFMLILFFASSTISFFKLFKTTTTSSNPCSNNTPPTSSHMVHKPKRHAMSREEGNLTTKEHLLVSNLISRKAPCNLLFFGLNPQLLSLAALNTRGTTAFLEDDEERIGRYRRQIEGVGIYRVEYREKASEAYELLRHAREHYGCRLEAIRLLQETGCKLGRIGLPKQVHERRWDVLVVDGPRGDGPDAPGRMSAIYTAAVMARTGNSTDVVVHDVHRTIEKWYSWEFLCSENLISSRGKLWHFRVGGESRPNGFCPAAN